MKHRRPVQTDLKVDLFPAQKGDLFLVQGGQSDTVGVDVEAQRGPVIALSRLLDHRFDELEVQQWLAAIERDGGRVGLLAMGREVLQSVQGRVHRHMLFAMGADPVPGRSVQAVTAAEIAGFGDAQDEMAAAVVVGLTLVLAEDEGFDQRPPLEKQALVAAGGANLVDGSQDCFASVPVGESVDHFFGGVWPPQREDRSQHRVDLVQSIAADVVGVMPVLLREDMAEGRCLEFRTRHEPSLLVSGGDFASIDNVHRRGLSSRQYRSGLISATRSTPFSSPPARQRRRSLVVEQKAGLC